jgi:hypothetical protein
MSVSSSSSQPAVSQPVQQLVVPESEAFVIVCSRDLSEEELSLLKEYGRVVLFDSKVYAKIQSLDFDYLVIDLRKSEDRHYLQQISVPVLEKYNLISVCHSIQKNEDYHQELGVDNVLSKLPPKQAFKQDFDRLLLQKKISKPNAGVSCIKSVFRLFNGQWN